MPLTTMRTRASTRAYRPPSRRVISTIIEICGRSRYFPAVIHSCPQIKPHRLRPLLSFFMALAIFLTSGGTLLILMTVSYCYNDTLSRQTSDHILIDLVDNNIVHFCRSHQALAIFGKIIVRSLLAGVLSDTPRIIRTQSGYGFAFFDMSWTI
ncbi:hypothetical protein P691DRAFT_158313 [Macrolepiota fuliginosa MF-IS2]|uniref:Uncharacterized protein n=1 Tax=Macrolepiota fuliginosa MF-IS2 TaxID=1400762 RepID=A0A9P5X9C9_9AGAR|nr:hypothetical protein P691DRAFT_158313 [Macrolepiota fuliginosa MF-IS2]